MSDRTGISYCDSMVNAIRGCTRCSPGCEHCWAIRTTARLAACHDADALYHPDGGIDADAFQYGDLLTDDASDWSGELAFDESQLVRPLHWRKPRVVFLNSMSDPFHPKVNTEWLRRLFGVTREAPQHQYLILTKRAKSMRNHLIDALPTENIWLGVTVCNQSEADEKLPFLAELATAGWKTWVSLEPLLSEIDISPWLPLDYDGGGDKAELIPGIRGVVVGGESGKGARPMKIEWAESVVRQCEGAGVPCYVKQVQFDGKLSTDPEEWPERLRVRNLPWRRGVK